MTQILVVKENRSFHRTPTTSPTASPTRAAMKLMKPMEEIVYLRDIQPIEKPAKPVNQKPVHVLEMNHVVK